MLLQYTHCLLVTKNITILHFHLCLSTPMHTIFYIIFLLIILNINYIFNVKQLLLCSLFIQHYFDFVPNKTKRKHRPLALIALAALIATTISGKVDSSVQQCGQKNHEHIIKWVNKHYMFITTQI